MRPADKVLRYCYSCKLNRWHIIDMCGHCGHTNYGADWRRCRTCGCLAEELTPSGSPFQGECHACISNKETNSQLNKKDDGMTAWKREDFGLSATINGREYWIEKYGTLYNVYCDGKQIPNSTTDALAEAKLAAEAHAVDTPTLPKQGVHMDDVMGQQLVDLLKRSFTWERIMTFGDLSPYDEPDTGAPEGPLS